MSFSRAMRAARDLALDPPPAEAARDEDPVAPPQALAGLGRVELLGVHPVDLHAPAVHEARVAQRLDDRQVGVLEADVLAHERDPHRLLGLVRAGRQIAPAGEVGLGGLGVEVLQDEVVDALLAEDERDLVDVVHVARGDDRLLGQRGEQGDLAPDVGAEGSPSERQTQHVGRDADAAQLVDRVLGGLGLQLARVADVRNERQVDVHAAAPPDVDGELADRLEEGQRLDVADRAADLGDDDVDVARLGDRRGCAA